MNNCPSRQYILNFPSNAVRVRKGKLNRFQEVETLVPESGTVIHDIRAVAIGNSDLLTNETELRERTVAILRMVIMIS